jgi:hypothetical protein
MRRIVIILAGAALALALVVPVASGVAQAGGRHGHHSSHGYSRHGHGGSCYGCFGPGTRCGRHGCDIAFLYPGYGYYGIGGYARPYGYGYGGYWWGGFGCNFDYPCGPPYDEQCRSFRGAPSPDPRCQAEQKGAPAPGQDAQPAPAQPAPDQGAQPAPDQDAQPASPPAQGEPMPRPY